MAPYSTHEESRRILHENLLADPALGILPSIRKAAEKITFTTVSSKPFVPTPLKITESSVSLNSLVAAAASAVATDRYGIDYQDIEINSDVATLFLESVLLPNIDGKAFIVNPQMQKALQEMDLHDMTSPLRRRATCVYQTKDKRWYQLHGSLNSTPTIQMMGLEGKVVTSDEEAINAYKEKVSGWESEDLERTANEQYRQAGVICRTPEEFFSSEHGKMISSEPLWTTRSVNGAKKPWPAVAANENNCEPLKGIRVLDLSRVIAGPAVSKLLAVMGADVIRISYSGNPEYAATMVDLQTGKRDVDLNLKTPEGKQVFEHLLQDADVLVDGFRPEAFKRLGYDSQSLRKLNPSLIYVRENCYGFVGPLAHRSGWQQISDCLVGISHLQGKFLNLDEAVVPLFPNSDYQTGLVGAAAVIQALLIRAHEDRTFDIDISLTQYNIWYYRLGLYGEKQQEELRAQDPDFVVRHFHDMAELTMRTHGSITKARPDLVRSEYFWDMDGSEWGVDGVIKILRPAFTFSRSKLAYKVPSGRRGRSSAEWTKILE